MATVESARRAHQANLLIAKEREAEVEKVYNELADKDLRRAVAELIVRVRHLPGGCRHDIRY